MPVPNFTGLRTGLLTLMRITEENFSDVLNLFESVQDGQALVQELQRSYAAAYDSMGNQVKYGFYTLYDGRLAGLSLLGVSSWFHRRGYTGADTLPGMRGQGIAPGSKPHLFYLGFVLLGLNRIETGCLVSNTASRHSIEKTPGFRFEGILREFARNERGEFEDEYRYAILRWDWESLYDPDEIELLFGGKE